jgi:heat shock protein HslJ
MKPILMLLPLAVFFVSCGSPKQIKGTGNAPVALNRVTSGNNASDTVAITGAEYIPVEGRNEAGVRPDLQGTWMLQSLNGSTITEANKLNIDVTNKALGKESGSGKKYENGTEVRRDSTVTKLKDGSTQTETMVYLSKDNRGNNITPPQGTNYHIPARPSLSFYGSNETFSGFTGCNKISGRYLMSGKNSISFQNASASTKMVCIGDYDENAFLDALHRVNSFRATNGKLELMDGANVVLVFDKK